METYHLPENVNVFCVTADSFPEGIGGAYARLRQVLPDMEQRTIFGISYMDEQGKIIYKAAAQENFEGEGDKLGLEPYTIQSGKYLVEKIEDWRKDESVIGKTFRKLGDASPRTEMPGIEWYQGGDVLCMLRLHEQS